MNLGKIVQTLLFLAVVVMIVRFVAVSIKTSGPPPVQYSIRFESRVSPDQNGLQVTNTNDFPWPDPVFTINGAYSHSYPGNVKGGETVQVPFLEFKDREGVVFRDLAQFHSFRIRTATMASTGAR